MAGLVITFTDFDDHAAHAELVRATLQRALPHQAAWRLAPRPAAAAAWPTDFVLVHLDSSHAATARAALRRHPRVLRGAEMH